MPDDAQLLLTVALLAYAATVAVIDLATRRIPNVLTVLAAATGLLLGTAGGGLAGLAGALCGVLVALLAFLPMYLAGGMGAGDVKAMAAVGACVGVPGVLIAVGVTLLIGAVAGLVVLVTARELVPAAQRLHASLLLARAGGAWRPVQPPSGSVAGRRFPYGLAIAGGAMAALWWMGRLQPLLAGGSA
jgi:prepilin peptidase CpaA